MKSTFLSKKSRLVLLVLLVLAGYGVWQLGKQSLVWTMVNVNYSPQQGDAHLIQTSKGKNILIDTGHLDPARKALVPFLQSKGIKKIDTVFVTHPHKDHYLGLLAILESGIPIRKVYFNMPNRKGVRCRKAVGL